MASSDRRPDYPLSSDLVKRLKAALDAKDEESMRDLICAEVQPVDAVIELANDDWMKDPSVQLPPGVLLGRPLNMDERAGRCCGRRRRVGGGGQCHRPDVCSMYVLVEGALPGDVQNRFTMERRPGPARTLQIFQKMEKGPQARTGAPVLEYHAALVTGDLGLLQPLMDQFFQDAANVVLEISTDEMEWQVKSPATFGLSGLWTLEYKRELTTPLCIAAAHGHQACVRHLLGRGANPDASPGGRGALHEACLGGHTACVQLLLQHCADPDLPSSEGLAPLHLCRTTASLGRTVPTAKPPPRSLSRAGSPVDTSSCPFSTNGRVPATDNRRGPPLSVALALRPLL
ncbi:Ankyrin repeat and SOCS box protein 18 [Tupaia chinensis]|uniref:Ankyrin repeat and SOCS box protein 18 n=1 Tax=Tupaia chinensis TaxID=246437 RepID=L9LBP8_TUPCH|nr:Ankyrin repeat and SOCS box protein 18 [Tupaia chinensis]